MPPIPQKWQDLADAGYVFDNEATCSGKDCHARIEWWITPDNQKMPMTVKEVKDGEGFFAKTVGFIRVPHWKDCPNAKDFRRRK